MAISDYTFFSLFNKNQQAPTKYNVYSTILLTDSLLKKNLIIKHFLLLHFSKKCAQFFWWIISENYLFWGKAGSMSSLFIKNKFILILQINCWSYLTLTPEYSKQSKTILCPPLLHSISNSVLWKIYSCLFLHVLTHLTMKRWVLVLVLLMLAVRLADM